MTPVREAALGGRGSSCHLWGSLIPSGRWSVEAVCKQMISPVDLPLPQVTRVETTGPGMWWRVRREGGTAWLTTDWKANWGLGMTLKQEAEAWVLGKKDERHMNLNGSTHPCTRGTIDIDQVADPGWWYRQALVPQGDSDERDLGIPTRVWL